MDEIKQIQEKIKKFNLERDWDRAHNDKDLVVALMSEVGELAECYRWLKEEDIAKIHSDVGKKKKIEEEIADIMIYLLILAYKRDIDLIKIIEEKLEKNTQRFPADKMKGVSTNPILGVKNK